MSRYKLIYISWGERCISFDESFVLVAILIGFAKLEVLLVEDELHASLGVGQTLSGQGLPQHGGATQEHAHFGPEDGNHGTTIWVGTIAFRLYQGGFCRRFYPKRFVLQRFMHTFTTRRRSRPLGYMLPFRHAASQKCPPFRHAPIPIPFSTLTPTVYQSVAPTIGQHWGAINISCSGCNVA